MAQKDDEKKDAGTNVIEDDDFDLSTLPKANKEEKTDEKKEVSGSPDEKKKDEEKSGAEDSSKEKRVEEKKEEKKEEEKKDEEKKDEKQAGKSDDPGSKEDDKSSDDKKGDDKVEDIFSSIDDDTAGKDELSFKSLLDEVGIEVEEEVKDKESFIKATKKAIESSKQKIDLSGFDEDAQKLITHLNEKKGNLASFFENPVISQMNRIMMLDPEERYREVRYSELYDKHKDSEKAIEALEQEVQEMSKGEIKTKSENIAEQASKIRQEEIRKVITAGEEKAVQDQKSQQENTRKQQENLISFIDKQDSFFGLPLSKEAKSTIRKDIDNGKFEQVVNGSPEATKFFAYMVGKYGEKIIEKYNKAIKEANREGHNNMQDKAFEALHGTDKKSQDSAGHKDTSGSKKNFENLTPEVFGEEG